MIALTVIIFDLGGVIIKRSFPPFAAEIEAVYGVPKNLVVEAARRYWPQFLLGKMSEEEYWRCISQDLRIACEPKRFGSMLRAFLVLDVDVYLLVKQLRKNYCLVLLSNVSREWMEHMLSKYPLQEIFNPIITSYDLKLAKPRLVDCADPTKIFRVVLERIDVKPEDCIFIDDHQENLEPAKSVGMRIILFQNAQQLRQDLEKIGIKTSPKT
jgi:HAD superfamily hydrolase (TIGR01509 family)